MYSRKAFKLNYLFLNHNLNILFLLTTKLPVVVSRRVNSQIVVDLEYLK